MNYLKLAIRIAVAVILIQTLRFKFTGHPDSVYIFTQVGLEPYGRIGIGIVELTAAGLILFSRTAWLGAGITVGVISGAIIMHLTKLGIEVKGDGGSLFYLAVLTFLLSLITLWWHRSDVPILNKYV